MTFPASIFKRYGGIFFFSLFLFLLFPPVSLASEQLPSDQYHRGVVTYGPYQIFPENRMGNSIYIENKLLLTLQGENILSVLPLPVEGRFVYLAKNSVGKNRVGAILDKSDPNPKITRVARGFFYMLMVLDGVVYKKLYRVQNQVVVDLLPSSKTADGIALGKSGVVFFHVSAMEKLENGTRFGMRLHFASFNGERLKSLDYNLFHSVPKLKLAWSDETQVQVTFGGGRTETISVSQFQ